jgi:hypothetical protein
MSNLLMCQFTMVATMAKPLLSKLIITHPKAERKVHVVEVKILQTLIVGSTY